MFYLLGGACWRGAQWRGRKASLSFRVFYYVYREEREVEPPHMREMGRDLSQRGMAFFPLLRTFGMKYNCPKGLTV